MRRLDENAYVLHISTSNGNSTSGDHSRPETLYTGCKSARVVLSHPSISLIVLERQFEAKLSGHLCVSREGRTGVAIMEGTQAAER